MLLSSISAASPSAEIRNSKSARLASGAVDCSVGASYSFHKFDVKLQQILRTTILQNPATSLVATSRTIVSVSRSLSVP